MGRRRVMPSMPWAAAASALLLLVLAPHPLTAEEMPLPGWMQRAAAALQGAEEGVLDPQSFVALRETVRGFSWHEREGRDPVLSYVPLCPLKHHHQKSTDTHRVCICRCYGKS